MSIIDENGNFIKRPAPILPESLYEFNFTDISKNLELSRGKVNDVLKRYKALSEAPIQASLDDKRIYVRDYLMDKFDLNKAQASALTGVWYAESKLDPQSKSKIDSGSGIAQWTGKRIAVFDDIYMDLFGIPSPGILNTTLEEQIEVAVEEYKRRKANWDHFTSQETLNLATDSVLRGYENGSLNSLATAKSINSVYKPVWDKKGIKYNKSPYDLMLTDRIKFSNTVYRLK